MATTKTAPKSKKNRHIVARVNPKGLKYWQCPCQALNTWEDAKCFICNEPHTGTEAIREVAPSIAPVTKKSDHVVARTMPDGLKYWQCSCKARNEWKDPKCVTCSKPHPNTEATSKPTVAIAKKTNVASLNWVSIDTVQASADNNRRTFNEESLQELADSLKQHGMLAPLVAFQIEANKLELIAGERRLRAARLAGMFDVPVRVLDVTPAEAHELRLVENLKREDLDPIEEAIGYQKLLDVAKITQTQLGERLGISQSKISNRLRLLKLPEEWQQLIITRAITEHHARPLLPLIDKPLGLAAIYREISSETDEEGDPLPIEEAIPSTREWSLQINAMLKRASAPVESVERFSIVEVAGGSVRGEGRPEVTYNSKNYLTPELIHEHAEELQIVEVSSSQFDQLTGQRFNRIQMRALNLDLLIRLNEEAKANQLAEVKDSPPQVKAKPDVEITESASSEPASIRERTDQTQQEKSLKEYLSGWFTCRLFDRLASGKVSAIPLTRMLLFALSRGVPDWEVRTAIETFEKTLIQKAGKPKLKLGVSFPGIGDGMVLSACMVALKSVFATKRRIFSIRELFLLAETAGIDFHKEWKPYRDFLELCDTDYLASLLGTGTHWEKQDLIDHVLEKNLPKKPPQFLLDLLKDDGGE